MSRKKEKKEETNIDTLLNKGMDIDDIINYLNDERLKKLREDERRVYQSDIDDARMIAEAENAANQARILQLAKDKQKEFDKENENSCAIQKRGGHVFNSSKRNKFIR